MPDHSLHGSFDEATALAELLKSLEYGSAKEDRELVDVLLSRHRVERADAGTVVRSLENKPGFEAVFLDVLAEVQPFAQMLGDVYKFLSARVATTSRRASKILIGRDNARSRLGFDLNGFPTEVVDLVTAGLAEVNEMELRTLEPPSSVDGSPLERPHDPLEDISPHWDGDFYDDGFCRALSYAQTICARGNSSDRDRLEAIAANIVDRLAAIVRFFEEHEAPDAVRNDEEVSSYMKDASEVLTLPVVQPARFMVRTPAGLAGIASPDDGAAGIMPAGARHSVRSMAVLVGIWSMKDFLRDDNDWLTANLGKPYEEITPTEYLNYLERLAKEFTAKLDKTAPVVRTAQVERLFRSLVELLRLPFWKQRWFLYELWTLVFVLETLEQDWMISLDGLSHRDDVLEWELPGGMAKSPVATIRSSTPTAALGVWTQRKTAHPETGKGIEPDLRITPVGDADDDVFVVESKDRTTTTPSMIATIIARYVRGTRTRSLWLTNYVDFPRGAVALSKMTPGRRIRVASRFRPGGVPAEFTTELRRAVAEFFARSRATVQGQDLGSTSAAAQSVDPDAGADAASTVSSEPNAERTAEKEPDVATSGDDSAQDRFAVALIELEWACPPADLDLHAWVADDGQSAHVHFGETGTLGSWPFVALRDDIRRGGKEYLTVRLDGARTVRLAVHNYSRDGAFDAASVVVRVRSAGKGAIELRPPTDGNGEWWHLGHFVGSQLYVANTIDSAAPRSVAS